MGVFKQREIRGIHGFHPEARINPVATQLRVLITRPSGTFRRFNQCQLAFRTAFSSHRGGR